MVDSYHMTPIYPQYQANSRRARLRALGRKRWRRAQLLLESLETHSFGELRGWWVKPWENHRKPIGNHGTMVIEWDTAMAIYELFHWLSQ